MCARAGARVPAALITLEMRMRGWSLRAPHQSVIKILKGMLSYTPKGPIPSDSKTPLVTSIRTVRGVARYFWAPANGAGLPVPVTAITTGLDAALLVTRDAGALVGRPLAPNEIWIYVRTLASSDAAHLLLAGPLPTRTGRGPELTSGGGDGPPRRTRHGGRSLLRVLRTEGERATRHLQAGGLEADRLFVVSHMSPYFAPGTAPRRYAVVEGPWTPTDGVAGAAAVHLDDAIAAICPDIEAETYGRLARALSPRDHAVLAPWLSARRETATRAAATFLRAAPPDPSVPHPGGTLASDAAGWRGWLAASAAAANRADRALLRLAPRAIAAASAAGAFGGAPTTMRIQVVALRRQLARRGAAVEALSAAIAADALPPSAPPSCPSQRVAASAGTVPLASITPWIEAYIAPTRALDGGDEVASAAFAGVLQELLADCRRFPDIAALTDRARRIAAGEARRCDPSPEAAGRERYGLPALPYVFWRVDRAEALVALAAIQKDPWTRMLLHRAYAMLGPITRDLGALATCLRAVGPDDGMTPAIRRRLVVAGGLLGAADALPAAERLVAAAGAGAVDGEADVRAAALATAMLGREALDALVAGPALQSLLSGQGGLAERAAKIRKRARAGLLFSVGAA